VELRVAALDLPGVENACYDVVVTNGLNELLWAFGNPTKSRPEDTQTICSDALGIEDGALSYFGPCDGSSPETTVTLFVDSLWAAGDVALTDWQNPCPSPTGCSVTTTCIPGGNVTAQFDLTVLREAEQGFFDISVNFDSIFCTAQVDCERQGSSGPEPITMLLDPATGTRLPTALLSFSCTAGAGRDTHLYLTESLVCGATTIPLSLAGREGNIYTADNRPSPILQAATYRGFDLRTNAQGQSSDVIQFTTAVALDFTASTANCDLVASLSATAGRQTPPFATPFGTIHPVIRVNTRLTNMGGTDYACTQSTIGDGPEDGLWVTYTSADGPQVFNYLAYEQDGTVKVEKRSIVTLQHYTVSAATQADSPGFTLIMASGQTSPFVLPASSESFDLEGGLISILTQDTP
jgi:hypothetical protein